MSFTWHLSRLMVVVVVVVASPAMILGECLTIHSSHTKSIFLGQAQFTVVQRANTIMAQCFLTSCKWARFPWEIPAPCLDSIVSPLRLRWVKGEFVFRYNLPSALLAVFYCNNLGWNGKRRTVSTESKLWRRKSSRQSFWGSSSQLLHQESGALPTSYPSSY